ncbi:Protein of unknown function, putative, partial [Plasmodium vivax]
FRKILKIKHEHDNILNINFNRLLVGGKIQTELRSTNVRQKLSDGGSYKKIIKLPDDISTFSGLEKEESNNIDIYMKKYKERYTKKKGLSKLDCYWEKKLFDKICYIDNLAKKMKNNKKSFKKKIINKYGYTFIIISLVPFILGIFPMINNEYISLLPKICFRDCGLDHKTQSGEQKTHEYFGYKELPINMTVWNIITYLNSVILWLSIFFVLSLVIYIFLKVIKYERLRRGKGKMSVKEYYRFCKDVF